MENTINEIARMTRDEVDKVVKSFPVAILPIGATEQHGLHLPLGTDTFLSAYISRRICEATGALLLPPVPFGYSWVWRDIPGTVSLEQDHVEMVIKDVAHSLSRYGVKLLVIVNGHDANNSAMKYATRELMDETQIKVIYLFYADLDKVINQYCESDTWYGMVHACEFETSLMLAVEPQLVKMDKAVREYPHRPDLYGKSTIALGSMSKSGVFGDPTVATKEKGELMLKEFVDKMTAYVIEAWKSIAE